MRYNKYGVKCLLEGTAAKHKEEKKTRKRGIFMRTTALYFTMEQVYKLFDIFLKKEKKETGAYKIRSIQERGNGILNPEIVRSRDVVRTKSRSGM